MSRATLYKCGTASSHGPWNAGSRFYTDDDFDYIRLVVSYVYRYQVQKLEGNAAYSDWRPFLTCWATALK